MAADPKRSEGARLERRAMRDHLRRTMKRAGLKADSTAWKILDRVLQFVLKRQTRYDRKSGGLGKK